MTRYARAGKGSHQRVAKDPTPWDDMKPPEPQRVRGNGEKKQFLNKNRKKERFTKSKGTFGQKSSAGTSNNSTTEEKDSTVGMADRNPNRSFKKSNNANIRGFGQSKSVKIFGQFWVPLDDAKRLKNLLKKLKAQGMARKEILEALQNERRKAEKASKRQRDKTCFQCRQFGHILSDCPNLRKASVGRDDLNVGEGEEPSEGLLDEQGLICFKCGSMEHTSRNCRRKGENFEFAKCFICSGSGHIARQCPKNTNGIYPSGGWCSECGKSTHLKKDCPDLFGVDHSKTGKDDQDAVTLRIADPFSSTEYEPVIDYGDEEKDSSEVNEEEGGVDVMTSKNTSSKPGGASRKGKKKQKTKIDMDDSPSALFDFGDNDASVSVPANKTLFASKKRKIVKF